MALESVSHLSDLVSTNPTSGDPKSEGDNHIRNIKVALLADLVNIATKSGSAINLPFPSGVIVKAGSTGIAATESSDITTTFGVAFPTACVAVILTDNAGASSNSVAWSVSAKTTTGFTSYWSRSGAVLGATNRLAFYIAIGY